MPTTDTYFFADGEFEQENLRGTIRNALRTYSLQPVYLTEGQVGPRLALIQLIRNIQAARFGIYRIDEDASANTFLALGIAIGLNRPWLLVARERTTIPVRQWGLSNFNFRSFMQLETEFAERCEEFLMRYAGISGQGETEHAEPRLVWLKGHKRCVYLIENDVRHWVPDRQTLETIGRWDDIKELTLEELKAFRRGKPLKSVVQPGKLQGVQLFGRDKVYLLEDGKRRWIPDLPTLESTVGWENVEELLSEEELAAFPLAESLESVLSSSTEMRDMDEGATLIDRWHGLLAGAYAAWRKTGRFILTRDEFTTVSEYAEAMTLSQEESLFMLQTALYFEVNVIRWARKNRDSKLAIEAVLDAVRGTHWRSRWRVALILLEMNPELVRKAVEEALAGGDLDDDAIFALKSVTDDRAVEHLRAIAKGERRDVMSDKARDILWQMGIDVEKTAPERERPAGVPSNLYSRLRETLLDCGPFGDDNQLRAVFAHASLRPWRYSVPQAPNPAARVDAAIAFLAEKRRADTQENALVLLLHALSERLDPADECHHRLAGLAGDLEHALGGGSSAGQTGLSTDTASIQPSMADTEIIAEIEKLVREDQLAEALVKLSKVVAYRRDATLLTQRLNRTRTQERQGLVTHEVADAERTKIAKAILDLISS